MLSSARSVTAIVLIAHLLLSESAISSQPPSDPSTWNTTQWTTWRDSQIGSILDATFVQDTKKVIDREAVISKCGLARDFLAPVLTADPNYFSRTPELKGAMGNFIRFVNAQSLMAPADTTKNNLAFTISDKDYWNAVSPDLQFPDLLKRQDFLGWMSDASTYHNAVEAIEQQNSTLPEAERWHVLPFNAQFIKSIPDPGHGRTYGRMIVLVPQTPTPDGGKLDRWILFSLATPDQPVAGDIRPVSMISVRRPPPQSNGTPGRLKMAFMDFIRTRDPMTSQISLVPSVDSPGHTSKNCYDCHKSAVLSIRPEFEYTFVGGVMTRKTADDGVVAGKVNNVVRAYRQFGLPDWRFLDTGAYGPSLGPDDRIRTDEFIANATAGLDLPTASYERIKNSMDCASCHSKFAPLNYLQAVPNNRDITGTFRRLESMIQTNIEEGWMPPNSNLTELERKALWRCVSIEYFDSTNKSGVFVNWLKGGNPTPDLTHSFATLLRDSSRIRPTTVITADSSTGANFRSTINLIPRINNDLADARIMIRDRRYAPAERLLWNGFDELRRTGVRGIPGLSTSTCLTDELRGIYQVWDEPLGKEGAKRLKLILDGADQ